MIRRSLFLILLAASSAHAQPVDDPGLAPPPAPPAPPATPAPPTAATPATPSAPASRAVTMTPMTQRASASPEVSERTEVKTDWVAPEREVFDLYERVAGTTLSGGTGLLRTQSGDIGSPGTFRIALHAGVFSQSQLVISGAGSNPGDTNTRFTGDLTISYTPWKYLEAYLGVYNTSNQNERTDPGRTDDKLLLSLGDFALGVKGRYPVGTFTNLGARFEVKFLDSINAASIAGTATNVTIDAISSFDLRKLKRPAPLRFHVNAGFLYDNSLSLLPAGQCATSNSDDVCIRSRAVETFAYGIGSSRVRTAFAADLPFDVHGVGVQPFAEYHLEIAVGSGDQTVVNALKGSSIGDRLSNPVIQYMTLGLRVRPIAGLILDAGLDVGLQSPGFQYGPPQPAWNVLLGAGYAYDTKSRRTKVVAKTTTREVARAPVEGKLRGIVRDANTKKPIEGAVVKYVRPAVTSQSTGQDGTFVSYKFAPGHVSVEISRDDYVPLKSDAEIVGNGETALEALLVPKPPANGQLHLRVSDPDGSAVMGATVHLVGLDGQGLDADADGNGGFNVRPAAGEWNVEVVAEGRLGRERRVTVAAGQQQSIDFSLAKKPSVSHVTLKAEEIAVKGTIHFSTNAAEILPDGEQLVDEVADVLVRNPRIKKLRIEGHTDNRGDAAKNILLSKQRAASVVAYLVKSGIDPTRLDSEGYGGEQPLVPNLTTQNRARNRRVAFRIIDQAP
jgi:outer membrane protein OmpA-like peptidoglycan-associated protein